MDRNKIFFVHVSKTAGVFTWYFFIITFQTRRNLPSSGYRVWTYPPPDVSQYRLFMGHFCHDFIDRSKGRSPSLSLLRDPLRTTRVTVRLLEILHLGNLSGQHCPPFQRMGRL